MVWPCKGKNPCSVEDFKSYFEEFGEEDKVDMLDVELDKIKTIMSDDKALDRCTVALFKHPEKTEYVMFCLPN